MKAENLCNGDLIQIGEEIFFANNVDIWSERTMHIERIDDDGRHPYRIKRDEEVTVHLAKQIHRYHGIVGPEKWYWAPDAVKALLVQNEMLNK